MDAGRAGLMLKVSAATLEAYLDFDSARRGDLVRLHAVVRGCRRWLRRSRPGVLRGGRQHR
jgi:hypothetical protein